MTLFKNEESKLLGNVLKSHRSSLKAWESYYEKWKDVDKSCDWNERMKDWNKVVVELDKHDREWQYYYKNKKESFYDFRNNEGVIKKFLKSIFLFAKERIFA